MAWFKFFQTVSVLLLLFYRECKSKDSESDLSLLLKLLEAEKESKNGSNYIAGQIKDVLRKGKAEEGKPQKSRYTSECASNEHLCPDGYTCFKKDWECDGFDDCPDKSDEIDCFECSHDPRGRLLPADRVCDDIEDCISGEDERGCKSPCHSMEFQCEESNLNSPCIPSDWTCDDIKDCENFADESTELCGSLSERCKPNTFVCGHELFCLPVEWQCDGMDDCGDNSDEKNCDEKKSVDIGIEDFNATDSNFTWGDWSHWSECDSLCDGEQVRRRRCNLGKCQGLTSESKPCGKKYPCMQEPDLGCGTRTFDTPSGRILGGANAKLHEWPWQAQIYRPGTTIPFCGGSMIKRNWILTAAHCFNKKKYAANKYSIALGRQHTFRSITDLQAVFVRAERLIIHESYKVWSHKYDIALMELEKYVPATTSVNVICLPTSGYDWSKHERSEEPDCYVTGFGINESGERPLVLQKARVRLIDHETCSAPQVYGNRIESSMICAGHLEGGIDACKGDSGGPLVCQNSSDGRWIQIGTTSWGKGCGLPNRPGVYTKISPYLQWIKNKTSVS